MLKLSDITYLLLIAHVLGDFHLQSEKLALSKNKSLTALLQHLLIHFSLLLPIGLIFILNGAGALAACLIGSLLLFHFSLDFLKISYLKRQGRAGRDQAKLQKTLYLLDQSLHLAAIVLAVQLFVVPSTLNLSFNSRLSQALPWLLFFLLISKPANVSFKICFAKYQLKPSKDSLNRQPEHEAFETETGAGATIGNLERFLSALFLAFGQFAAIGLIYTAKSICRYKKMEENKRFAEYYLIGSLYSILYVVSFYFLLIG